MSEFKLDTMKIKTFSFVGLNPENEDKAKCLVRFVILDAQLDNLMKKLPDADEWESFKPGTDFMQVDNDVILEVYGDRVGNEYLTVRDNIRTVKIVIGKLNYGLDAFNALSTYDQYMVIIEAHKSIRSINLPKSAVEGISFNKAIKAYYSQAFAKDAKDCIRAGIDRVFSVHKEGDMFDKVAFKKSELDFNTFSHYMASFGGNAKRNEKKKKDGTVTIMPYDYVIKAGWKEQTSALTTLLGVLLEARFAQFEGVVVK